VKIGLLRLRGTPLAALLIGPAAAPVETDPPHIAVFGDRPVKKLFVVGEPDSDFEYPAGILVGIVVHRALDGLRDMGNHDPADFLLDTYPGADIDAQKVADAVDLEHVVLPARVRWIGIPEHFNAIVLVGIRVCVVVIGPDMLVIALIGDIEERVIPEHLDLGLLLFPFGPPGELERGEGRRSSPVIVVEDTVDGDLSDGAKDGIFGLIGADGCRK